MPAHRTEEADAYLCTRVPLPENETFSLRAVTPLADASVVHHMLLFGCSKHPPPDAVWPCKMSSPCHGAESVLYGWGRNSKAVRLPENTGFAVGAGTSLPHLVLQVHYLLPRVGDDASGVELSLSASPSRSSAGMITYAAAFTIPPAQLRFPVRSACCLAGLEPLHALAARVHTHALGRRVYLERSPRRGTGGGLGRAGGARTESAAEPEAWDLLASLDPLQPQGFYALNASEAVLYPGDTLRATCDFESVGLTEPVSSGHGASAEMCNLYLLLRSSLPRFGWCLGSTEWLPSKLPGGLPRQGTLVELDWKVGLGAEGLKAEGLKAEGLKAEGLEAEGPKAEGLKAEGPKAEGLKAEGPKAEGLKAEGLKAEGLKAKGLGTPSTLGQATGLALASSGEDVWVLHRGEREWDAVAFDASSHALRADWASGHSMQNAPLVLLDGASGAARRALGAGLFWLPHAARLDQRTDTLWVADVGRHQVLALDAASGEVKLTLGREGRPGSGPDAFCQPTDVSVSHDGQIFVGDGYCNARVAQFDRRGAWVRDLLLSSRDAFGAAAPKQGPASRFQVPHAVLVHDCLRRVYVADREAGLVHAFGLSSGSWEAQWQLPRGGLPYALTMGPYGRVAALSWRRAAEGAPCEVVVLSAGAGVFEGEFEVPGPVRAPHSLAFLPDRGAGAEVRLAVLVGETGQGGGNRVLKFALRPAAEESEAGEGKGEGQEARGEHDERGQHDKHASHAAMHSGLEGLTAQETQAAALLFDDGPEARGATLVAFAPLGPRISAPGSWLPSRPSGLVAVAFLLPGLGLLLLLFVRSGRWRREGPSSRWAQLGRGGEE